MRHRVLLYYSGEIYEVGLFRRVLNICTAGAGVDVGMDADTEVGVGAGDDSVENNGTRFLAKLFQAVHSRL